VSKRSGGKYWSASVLKKRGWTNELIRELLPKPRMFPSHSGSVRVWSREAVREAEQEARFLRFLRSKYGPETTLSWEKSDRYPRGFRMAVYTEFYDWSVDGRLRQLKDRLEDLPAGEGDVFRRARGPAMAELTRRVLEPLEEPARAAVEDKVDLLQGGAADYLTKPFDTRELLARIAVQLRRQSRQDGILRYRGIALAPETREATVDGGAVRLTRTEYGILKLLMQNPRQVITKSQLLEQLSMDTPDCVESSLKVHVSNLRRKLREAGAGECIESVWGIGFTLKIAEQGAVHPPKT